MTITSKEYLPTVVGLPENVPVDETASWPPCSEFWWFESALRSSKSVVKPGVRPLMFAVVVTKPMSPMTTSLLLVVVPVVPLFGPVLLPELADALSNADAPLIS